MPVVDPDEETDGGGEAGQLPVYPGRPGHLPSRPTKEQILAVLEEHEEEIRAKIDEIRDAVADRIPGIKEKLEAIKTEIAAKIEEIKSQPVDPGYGVEEGAPGQGLPDRLEAFKESLAAKLDQIKAEIANRIPGIQEKIDSAKQAIADAVADILDKIHGDDCAAKIAEIKAAVRAKIEALKAELAGKGHKTSPRRSKRPKRPWKLRLKQSNKASIPGTASPKDRGRNLIVAAKIIRPIPQNRRLA